MNSISAGLIPLDLNDPVFQQNLFKMQKPERRSAMETLQKLSQMTWNQLYNDNGLKWEKLLGTKPPRGVSAVYSLRITQSRRATACREGEFLRFLSVAPDHDSTSGKQ